MLVFRVLCLRVILRHSWCIFTLEVDHIIGPVWLLDTLAHRVRWVSAPDRLYFTVVAIGEAWHVVIARTRHVQMHWDLLLRDRRLLEQGVTNRNGRYRLSPILNAPLNRPSRAIILLRGCLVVRGAVYQLSFSSPCLSMALGEHVVVRHAAARLTLWSYAKKQS